MSSTNKPTHRCRSAALACAIPFAVACNLATALEKPDSGKTPAATVATEKAIVPEGRKAVDFYQDGATSKPADDRWRLSDTWAAYPVNPVERPQPLFELGDPFIGNGPIRPGIKTPTGQMLQPWFLLYGSLRSAFQGFDNGRTNTTEWVNRLDLNGNLNLSGTERLVFSMRPLDSRTGGYSGYGFSPDDADGWHDDFNARLTRLYFEGDLGEIFPGLDPSDSHTYDLSFSVGRQYASVQDGILLNDLIDMAGITRNSLVFPGISNLRITGIYGWNHINRGNNERAPYSNPHQADLFALLSEADTALNSTVNLDLMYLRDDQARNAYYLGASSTQRLGWVNSTFRINASIPESADSPTVGRGVLLYSQLSRTLHGSDDLAYFNTFIDIGNFTSASRSPDQGTPVANMGILYGPVGMARYGVPLGHGIADTIGTALGYQMFVDGIDGQLIFELGARTSTRKARDEGSVGFGARFQHSFGSHHVVRLDSFVAGEEHVGVEYGWRTEWMVKF